MPQDAPLEICRSSSRAPFVLFVEGTLGVPYAKTVLVPGWFKLIAPNSFSVQCPRRFCELDPEMLHTCFTCPCRIVDEWGVLYFYFFRQIFCFRIFCIFEE